MSRGGGGFVVLGQDVALLPGADRLLALHAAELPQKDELCGAFWGLLALRAANIEVVDQDQVAAAAGSVISSVPNGPLPAGERGRRDYRLELPTVDDSDRSGTTVAGLIDAVRTISNGEAKAIPAHGDWTPERVSGLLEIAADLDAATVIANVGTRFLWGGSSRPDQIAAYLTSGDPVGPEPDWDVGHFVALAGCLPGPAGMLVVVADTYRTLGHEGVHLQPIEALAEGLCRPGMTSGGVLLVTAAASAPEVAARLARLQLQVGPWDNGTEDAR